MSGSPSSRPEDPGAESVRPPGTGDTLNSGPTLRPVPQAPQAARPASTESVANAPTMRLPEPAHAAASGTSRPGKDDLDFGETVRSFRVGQKVFHRYTLKRILGRGGMGVVWLAHDEKLAQAAALKFIPEVVRLDAMAVEELKSETRRSLQLTHPNIVRIYDFVDDEETAAIAMEFVDGPSLSLLRAQRDPHVFRVDEITVWIRQLCEALHYAHQDARVAHRDIKPANLLTNSQAQLKVADFGIARHLCDTMSRISHHSGPSGTLIYMSPQQLEGDHPSPQDDIYAVGATIYELLTSRTPFYSGDIARQVLNKVPPPMAQRRRELQLPVTDPIPDAWEEVVAACLAKDPSQRPGSGGEILDRLGLTASRSQARPAPPAPFTPFSPEAEAATIRAPELAPTVASVPTARSATVSTPTRLEKTVQLPPSAPIPAQPPTRPVQTVPERRQDPWMWVAVAAIAVLLLGIIWLLVGPAKRGDGSKDALAPKPAPTNLVAQATSPPPSVVSAQPQPAPAATKPEPTPPVTQPATPPQAPSAQQPVNALVVKPVGKETGEVILRVAPPGAKVTLGNETRTVTGTEPLLFQGLAPGSYTVQVTMDGYQTAKEVAKVTPKERADLGTMTLVRNTGSLNITSEPAGADYLLTSISENATSWMGKTPKTERGLPVGDYLLTFRYKDLPPKELQPHVAVGAAEQAYVKFEFGRVEVTSEPSGATVKAGDRVLGKTPYNGDVVKPGRVLYLVEMAGYSAQAVEGEVVVASKPLSLHAKLAPEAQAANPLAQKPATQVAVAQPPPVKPAAKPAEAEPDLSSRNSASTPVVAKPAPPSSPLAPGVRSVFALLADGNLHVPEASSNLVTHVEGKRRPATPFPQEWTAYYYDQKLTLKLRQVTYLDGKLLNTGASTDPFNPKSPHPSEQLKVDAPEAMAKIQALLPSPISSSQWELRRFKGTMVVWQVKVWVTHPRNPRAEIGLGEVSVSAQDGAIVENHLNLRAIR